LLLIELQDPRGTGSTIAGRLGWFQQTRRRPARGFNRRDRLFTIWLAPRQTKGSLPSNSCSIFTLTFLQIVSLGVV
jgi:hypothetical protein